MTINEYSSEADILKQAKSLEGKTVLEIVGDASIIRSAKGKGAIGNLIERHGFGISNNSRPEADFIHAGIELKVVPLIEGGKGLRVKERTKICSIDFDKLVHETWEKSHAWRKLRRVLLVFFEYDAEDAGNSRVRICHLYEPDMTDQEIMRDDWNRVLNYVKAGEAHKLSESLSVILAASRTGQGGVDATGVAKDMVSQPVTTYQATALKRAFSLKPSYTNQIYQERNRKTVRYVSLNQFVKGRNFNELIGNVIDGLNRFKGMTLADFAHYHSIDLSDSKQRSARILRAALGIKADRVELREFDRYGIVVKTPPVRPADHDLWENVSFPYQPLAEIAAEGDFMDSMIAEWTRRILFVPMYRNTRKDTRPESIRIGKAFLWEPTVEQDERMAIDYTRYVRAIEEGIIITKVRQRTGKVVRQNNLPKESDTHALHMRPHGRDGSDLDLSLPGVEIIKQSFWLNGGFVRELIRSHY